MVQDEPDLQPHLAEYVCFRHINSDHATVDTAAEALILSYDNHRSHRIFQDGFAVLDVLAVDDNAAVLPCRHEQTRLGRACQLQYRLLVLLESLGELQCVFKLVESPYPDFAVTAPTE